ncbi:MAG: efflux RND transporter permease subunit [Chloroflexi bacterium]|nr:efflux RND transporter permease subunit [Chloroflexota bacterium]
MGITRLALTRPLAILMFILGFILMGAVSYRMLTVDRFPRISFPFVNVSVTYAGAAPEDVEELVVKPLEAAVSGIPGLDTVDATASAGRATINIRLVEGSDADKAAIDVERRVAAVRSRLPEDVSAPSVNKADPQAQPILNIVLTGRRPPEDLYQLATDVVQPSLQAILGVADVQVSGGLQKEIRVAVDYRKLEAYGLSVQHVNTALSRENVSLPGGTLDSGRRTVAVRAFGLYQKPEDLESLIIGTGVSGSSILLKDVAKVSSGYKDRTRIVRYSTKEQFGQDAIGLNVVKQSDANTIEVAASVRRALTRIESTLPPGVSLSVTNDTSRYVRRSIDAIQYDLGLAIFLTATVLILFLHSWRNTIIVVLAIPTSLITTFLFMYAFGFSLNLMSMMALAMTIGILVDDSIVVLENIHRHLELGEHPMVAALKGRSEIGLAAIAITLTDVIVYLPVGFMQGNIGRLFREYGLTMAIATLLSLMVSFTLTPMLASRWLSSHQPDHDHGPKRRSFADRFKGVWDRGFDAIASGYGNVLGWSLGRRPIILMVGVLAVVAAYSFIQFNLLGLEYAPQEDDNQFSVSVSMPPATNLATTDTNTKVLEQRIAQIPEVEAIFTSIGGGGGFFAAQNQRTANLSVQLVEKDHRSRTIWQVTNDVRRLSANIPEMTARPSVASSLQGGGGGNNLSIRLIGEDLNELNKLAAQVEEIIKEVPGVADTQNSSLSRDPEIRAIIDRSRAADLGVTAQQIAQALRTSIQGTVVTQFRPEGQSQIDVTLIAADADRLDFNRLADVPLSSSRGGTVRLGQVAKLERSEGPTQIQRTNRQRVLTVSGVVQGRPLGDVARDARQALSRFPLPPGYQLQFSGAVQQLNLALAALGGALVLSILLIYMLMVALYESWLYPLAIMFSLPVSLIGAFGLLMITGNTLNIFSIIGIIMLMGLVAKNAILLVDFTNTLRERGLERFEAIVEAGRTRLRPIVMTTATVIFAMLPLATSHEAGSESRAPMAVVVIGGSISSTLLTLVLVPVVYTYLDDLQHVFGRWRHRRQPAPAAALAERETAPAIAGGSE